MSDQRVSSLLIIHNGALVGIVTDRDLRSRCLAAGLAPSAPIEQIMSRQLHKVSREVPAYEAILTMARLGIHHLPVLDRGELTGLVSLTDLMQLQRASAAYLAGGIRKCESLEALREICAELPQLQVHLVASGVSAFHLGQTISSVTDAITIRLLELAEAKFGPAPIPYAWMAVGAQARREQTVHSDQDHALMLSDDYRPEAHEDYFTKLAQFVSDGLKECGFDYCAGEVMATNPKWRQPRAVWRRYFDGWIMRPERKAMMLAANFFDMRCIYGEFGLWESLHAEVLGWARGNTTFIAHMSANAVRNRPPLGFFRNFVLVHGGEHANTLDIKLRGIMPTAELARVYALMAGLPEVNTCERLRAAAQVHAVSEEGAANLEDSFELMTTLRATHQAEQIRAGGEPDNYIAPGQLSALERAHLKDAFSVLNTMQRALAQRYQSERFA
jgi:CBS domain-containing protein